MDDAAYAFAQDVKDRKRTATGAYHKRTGSRSRKVSLTQDTMTQAQWKRRNGPVQTYEMNKPHTLSELRTWPRDMQRTYMSDLLTKFNPTNVQLSSMLDCSPTWLYNYLKTLCIKGTGSRPTKEKKLAFEDWLHADDIPAEKYEEPALTETPAEQEPEEEKPTLVPITYDTISLSFTGTTTDLIQSILTGPLHLCGADTCTFTITAQRKG